jgi:hypothetical protein
MATLSPLEVKLNIRNFLMVALIALLELFGMYAALFFEGPESGSAWPAAMSSFSVMGHMMLGLAVLVFGLIILINSLATRKSYRIWASIVGLAGILAASAFGSMFLSQENDLYTFLMAVAAVIAQIAYAYSIVRAHHDAYMLGSK